MQYLNKKTGCVIETNCTVSGGDWTPIKPKPAKKKSAADAEQTDKTTDKR